MVERRSSLGRHTGRLEADPAKTAAIEAENALRQFDEVLRLAEGRIADGSLSLTPSDLCELQRLAVQGIWGTAGLFREIEIEISNTEHRPPPAKDVPRLVAEMCTTANDRSTDGLWTCAYLMWRLNWIHPFGDGNGRTSRAVGYLALCFGFRMLLPGTETVPDMIAADKGPYYDALDAADAAWLRDRSVDVSAMQELVTQLLTKQLRSE